MKKGIFSSLLLILLLTAFGLTSCTFYSSLPKKGNRINVEDGSWTLTFQDEFEGNQLDETKWSMQEAIRRAAVNTSDPENIIVEDGVLKIRTVYRDTEYGKAWTTGFLSTATYRPDSLYWKQSDSYQGFSQTYGYFEIRCIAPPTEGIWSAFWLMPDAPDKGMTSGDVMWTGADGVEIDIMESPFYYTKQKSLLTHVLHGDGYGDNLKSASSKTYKIDDMYQNFHTYGVEWNEEEYIFYIDGIETWRTKHEVKDPETGKMRALGVSEIDQFLKLTVEVSGSYDEATETFHVGKQWEDGRLVDTWCGQPMHNDVTKAYDFVIDYVRVYQKTARL